MKLLLSGLWAGLYVVAADALNRQSIVLSSHRFSSHVTSGLAGGEFLANANFQPNNPDRIDREIARKAGEVLKDRLGVGGKDKKEVNKTNAGCGTLLTVDALHNPVSCPEQCPLFAEVPSSGGSFCQFRCVKATPQACAAVNPDQPAVNADAGMCSACHLTGCSKCVADGRLACAVCQAGYSLANGSCYSHFWLFWILLFSFIGTVVAVIIAWIVDLSQREVLNQEKLDKALLLRSQSKLHTQFKDAQTERIAAMGAAGSIVPGLEDDEDEDDDPNAAKRRLYPLSTNLLRKPVAGPGLVLSFNFQFIVIVWAFGVAISWVIYSRFVDEDLLVLGTKVAETVKDYCHVVAWGFETQKRLMWAKADFVLGLYCVTFIGCLLHSIRQLRMFQSMDIQQTTHKDFCARCTFKTVLQGDQPVEDQLKDALEKGLGLPIVGVSVCWDYAKQEQEVMKYLSELLMHREGTYPTEEELTARAPPTKDDEDVGETKRSCCGRCLKICSKVSRKVFERIEKFYLAPETQRIVTKERMSRGYAIHQAVTTPRHQHGNQMVEMARLAEELKTTGEAFAVFKTEGQRDYAVEQSKLLDGGGIEFGDDIVFLEEAVCEPDTILWANCVAPTWWEVMTRVTYGIGVIGMALLAWVCLFYFPYANYITSYDYSYGTVPDFVPMMVFTMIVVCGNALMYFVCSIVAERVGFRYQDHREVCYMLLYIFACMVNVVMDLFTTYVMVYRWMVGKGVRTYDGTPLAAIGSFTQAFETYAMQRALGDQLLLYSFPGTFLYPFLFEPFLSIIVPYQLMSMIVRSHRSITVQQAERYLSAQRMDLSRYADLHVNIILATISFYFPGGFIPWMFLYLACSHCYIYLYDHCRVLRSIPHCEFSRMEVDWWAQWLMSIGCAILLSSCVFKFNCQEGLHCASGWVLIAKCAAVGIGHVVLHTLLLVYVVPLFGIRDRPPGRERYSLCSRKIACNWFNANPIQCIRSQLYYKHSPPCHFFFPGKEHMLEPNPEIGQFFMDQTGAEVEDWGSPVGSPKSLRNLFRGFTDAWAVGSGSAESRGPSRQGTRQSTLQSPMGEQRLPSRGPSSPMSNAEEEKQQQAPVPGG